MKLEMYKKLEKTFWKNRNRNEPCIIKRDAN